MSRDEQQGELLLKQKLFSEQIERLYSQAPVAFIMQLFMAGTIAYSVHGQIGTKLALTWCIVLSSIFLVDFLGYVAFRQFKSEKRNPKTWYRIFVFSVICVSLSWGLGSLYLISKVNLPHQMFIVITIVMIMGGGLPMLSNRMSSLVPFQLCNSVPSVIWLITNAQEPLHYVAALFLTLFAAAMLVDGFSLTHQLWDSLRLRFVNEQLANSLKDSNGRLKSLNKELTRISSTDALTHVANRRYFDERLEQEWKRVVREEHQIAVIMVDVDHFKQYNDTFGHQQGDICLEQVAICIRDTLRRPADMVARYGGEEFIVLLPNTTSEGAVRVAEMIRENVLALEIPHPVSETHELVTVSVGVGFVHATEKSQRRELIAAADQALYQSKDNGRNQVNIKIIDSTTV